MKNKLSGYLWGYKNIEAGEKSIETFKKFYPDSDLFITVDVGGEIDGYTEISNKYNANIKINSIKIGRCGIFGDYSNSNPNGDENFRTHWPKENAFEWLDGIYDACLKTLSKYMIILEEDVFILKPISILNREFGASIVTTNNIIPDVILNFIKSLGGNVEDNKYGCCGGCIINTQDFIRGYEFCKDELFKNYDEIGKYSKLIGWSDCILQVIIQCAGSRVIVNQQLVEPWMQTEGWIKDDWRNYEIVNYLKDIEIIKQL
jgi:hypothetical protein